MLYLDSLVKSARPINAVTLILSLGILAQSCTASRMPMMLNCSKQGKGGIWVEEDTTLSGSTIYAVSRYKNGEKQGRHFAYRRVDSGLMWRREKGQYRHGQKAGLWIYYTTCGYYLNWVYYWRGRDFHNRVINSVHGLDTCPCDKR